MKAPVGYAPASKSFVSALENRGGIGVVVH